MYEEEISKLSTDLQRITGSEGHHIERSETLEAQTNELMAKVNRSGTTMQSFYAHRPGHLQTFQQTSLNSTTIT